MNTNCLAGIACPQCGQSDRFSILAQSAFLMTDEGSEEHSDIEWDDDSHICCPVCSQDGTVAEFQVEED